MHGRLKSLRKPIGIHLVGAGAMGRGLLYQFHTTPGFRCLGLADIRLDRAVACVEWLGIPYRLVDSPDAAAAAIAEGRLALCEDGRHLARCPAGDVLLETSSAIVPSARFVLDAISAGKHIVLMNAEVDLAFGPLFLEKARAAGVVYTSCDGDQHGVLARLGEEVRLWGFDPVLYGNIKGFLDRYSNPTAIVPEADKRNLDYRMATAYTDGTKLSVEMALVANGLGARAPRPGMQGPAAVNADEALSLFDLPGLASAGSPAVDYVLGAEPGGGVFLVGRNDNPYQRGMLSYYKKGNGPFYLFCRPHHLCHIEAARGVAEAVLDGKALLQPSFGFRANVTAYAKTDLPAGTVLDGVGGYHCYGMIENIPDPDPDPGLPVCLAEGVTLRRAFRKDERILLREAPLADGFALSLYRQALAASERLKASPPPVLP